MLFESGGSSTSLASNGYLNSNGLRSRKPIPSDQQSHPSNTKTGEQFPKATRQILKLFLPSTYVRKIFPTRFYRGCCTASAIFWFVIGVLVIRKTQTATTAVRYIKTHSNTVALETIEKSEAFSDLIRTLDTEFTRPPAFFLLNQYALNMTFNVSFYGIFKW